MSEPEPDEDPKCSICGGCSGCGAYCATECVCFEKDDGEDENP